MSPIIERRYYRIDTIAHKTDKSSPFYTNLSQKLPSELEDANALPILLRFYKSIERKLISDDDDVRVLHEDLSTDLEDKKLIRVPRDDTGTCSTLVTDVLNDMDIPKDDHESILGEVVQGVQAFCRDPHHHLLENVHHALSDVVLLVDICDVTLQIAFATPPQNQACLCNY